MRDTLQLMSDFTQGLECATVRDLLGPIDGTGPLFSSRPAMITLLTIMVFRTIFEVDPSTPSDVVVLPNTSMLSVGESRVFSGKVTPARCVATADPSAVCARPRQPRHAPSDEDMHAATARHHRAVEGSGLGNHRQVRDTTWHRAQCFRQTQGQHLKGHSLPGVHR